MTENDNTIERKAVNTSGRLGSLYDGARDQILNYCDVKTDDTQKQSVHSEYKVWSGEETTNVIDILKFMKFNDELIQSILLGLVQSSGISAIIDYKQPINENTQFFYYSYMDRIEELNVTDDISLPTDVNNATHMITKINWGFEIICIIQNPDKDTSNQTKSLLNTIFDRQQLQLSADEELQLKNLSNISIYGAEKFANNDSIMTLHILLDNLLKWRCCTDLHYPILYAAQPLRKLYPDQNFTKLNRLKSKGNQNIKKMEQTIVHLHTRLEHLQYMFQNRPKDLIDKTFELPQTDFSKQFATILSLYDELRRELASVLVEVRCGTRKTKEIIDIISKTEYESLKPLLIDSFHENVESWLNKVRFVAKLKEQNINYVDIVNVLHSQTTHSTFEEIDELLKSQYSRRNHDSILWYASDRLKREKPTEWESMWLELTSQLNRRENETVSFNYIDFSRCNFKLEDFIKREVLASSNCNPSQEHTTKEINVLILGETGVGKSTFINAFVNYLVFDSLQQAEQSQPVVLIPVSFIMTQGDHFQEVNVKFGNLDKNENFEHEGQSVTQQCKSYIFKLNDQTNLRLIDTPGINDTRGVDQDNKNMEHIFTYINNLSHLNAICLLLKPNNSKLTTFFRSCISQLFNYLTPISYGNVIFCFTNARSTFFTPGDSGPLIREMLKKEYHDAIPFTKENTFCFDSESFRYLAAKKYGVEFEEFYQKECIKSWKQSVMQSTRLIQYIKNLTLYNLHESNSVRKALLDIHMLARPLMETIRIRLYSMELRKAKLNDKRITLRSKPVTLLICTKCSHNMMNQSEIGSFYTTKYEDNKDSTIKQCVCSSSNDDDHFLLEYLVRYDFTSNSTNFCNEQIKYELDQLLDYYEKLVVFLQYNDLFKPILERFLKEEDEIIKKHKPNLNKAIKRELRRIQKRCQSKATIPVEDVYKIINELKTIQEINKQVEDIKICRQSKMKVTEQRIELPENISKSFDILKENWF